jgi:hypothetical protein
MVNRSYLFFQRLLPVANLQQTDMQPKAAPSEKGRLPINALAPFVLPAPVGVGFIVRLAATLVRLAVMWRG